MRVPVSRSRNRGFGAGWRASQAFLILSLLISLVAPLFAALPAAALQGAPFPPPLPEPSRVALSGSFQAALGCPADFDPTCPQTALQDNRDGSWSAVLPVPPGDYAFRVVAASDQERSLGERGDPNGGDLFLNVPGDAAGAYFRYDSLTGEILAEPVARAATLVTDLGEQFAMAPAPGGGYEVAWDAQAGSYGFQIQINGQPVAQDSVSLDRDERVFVAIDAAGTVTAKNTVPDTTLAVSAADSAGNLPDAGCFAIIDRENRLRTQACDEDDGQADGIVPLRVPDGLPEDAYTLRQTAAPDGSTPAADQEITLGGGQFEAFVQSADDGAETAEPAATEPGVEQPSGDQPAGAPVVEPGEQPGRLTVVAVDEAGQPLPGACFAVVEFGFELCDDDLDGEIIFDSVPSAPLTLRETTPPAGFAAVSDLPITIEPTGARFLVPHVASGEAISPVATETPAATPDETPQAEPAGANEVRLSLRDRDGQPVTGACWALTDRDAGGTIQACDADDGSEDGEILFAAVAAGRYRLDEVTTPAGFRPADNQGIDVVDGAPAQATIEYRGVDGQDQNQNQEQRQGGPGRLVIDVADEDGNPLPETCFDLTGPVDLVDVCDNQNDGRLNLPDLPAGEYTVRQTRTAGGFVPAAETTVVVPADDTIELPLVNRSETAESEPQTPVADEGSVLVTLRQTDGSPLQDACVELANPASTFSVCDNAERDESGEPGQIEIAAVAPGDYTLTIVPPSGSTAPEPSTIQVAAGQPTALDVTIDTAEEPVAPETGNLSIAAADDAGNPLPAACYTVEIPPGGQSFGPFCDEDGNGVVEIQGVSPGPVAVIEATPPTNTSPADPAVQEIDIPAGEASDVVFRHGPAAAEQPADGIVAARIVDAAGQPVAACLDLDGDAGTLTACDNEAGDEDDGAGLIQIERVIPGTYQASLSGLPDGATAPAAQEIEVTAGETTNIDFVVASGPGTLVLFVEDASGERLGGSCFTIQGRGETETLSDVCDQGDDGRLNLPDLAAGDYTIIQTRAGENRQLATEQTVTVPAGQTVELTFLNPLVSEPATPSPSPAPSPDATATVAATVEPEASPTPLPEATAEAIVEQPAATGTLAIVNLAPDNTLLGDACFSITDAAGAQIAERCDNDGSDFDNTPGVIAFGALPVGAYTLTQTGVAEGFSPAPPVQIDHGADDQAIDVFSESATAETGVVELAAFADDGSPISGQCYTLTGAAGTFGPFCDDGEGDASGEPGVLTVEGLPTGTYEATLESVDAEPDAELAQGAKPRRSVSVRKGGRPTRASFNVRAQQNRRGDLLIRVRDQEGRYLDGACFGLIPDGESAPSQEVCDNRGDDQNSSAGRILLTGLRTGRYSLTQTTAPNGYAAAADQSLRIEAGSVREVSVTNERQRDQLATLDVQTLDRQGNRLNGACYEVVKGTSTTDACDADTGADGVTRFADIEAGSYVVRQTQPPSGGFALAGATATLLNAGQTATVTVVNEPRAGSLLVRKTDEAGQLLAGSCFALLRDNRSLYTLCDNDANDGNRAAGIMLLGTIAPGTYTLRETQAPAGYLVANDQQVEITANQRNQVTVINPLAPPAERTGDLRLFKIDTRGRALAGSCFALIDGAGQLMRPTCDADDSADNGVILMEGVGIGDYTLRETRRPSANYETAADRAVTVIENETVDVEIENRLRTGSLLIRKFSPNGAPLAGACFDLTEDSAGAACTDGNGELLFSGLVPGTYQVIETEAPAGYLITSQISPVTVRPGSTATVDVVDQLAPPPPDSGSLQVVKFLCPATAGNGGIAFVDSSDPDGGGLARTAGCDLGNAAFTLDGPEGRVEFRTSDSGRYQTTLPTGDYVLTEVTTGAAENLVVSVNTLTTIVVINYVEPEVEEPAAIDVIKYTCDAGFQGRIWRDFADGCLSEENLTNNVSFRLSGMVSARRVTGDAGIGGATRFDGLPAGDYQLREETPAGTVAVYAFCGLDPAAPNGRAVGDALALRLSSGQLVTCYWFNAPEDLAGDTGAITVYKYACPVSTPSASFDWYGRCDAQGLGVRFSLAFWDGAAFVPVTVGATDSDGILRLTRLQPGLYDLKEVDAAWCHAESDSVDADGRVVVAAGERSSIWIFNCVGAKNPPNTGAGPMWSGGPALPAALSSLSSGVVAFNLLWPLAGLAVLRRRGRAA